MLLHPSLYTLPPPLSPSLPPSLPHSLPHSPTVGADLNEVQDPKLTLVGVHTEDEVKGGIMAVDQSPVPTSQLAANHRQMTQHPTLDQKRAEKGQSTTSGGLPGALQEVAARLLAFGHHVKHLLDHRLLLVLVLGGNK